MLSNETFPNISSFVDKSLKTPFYIYVWVSVVNIVIFLAGCVGNILVILVVIRLRSMRTSTNYCLLNLCFADLLILVTCQTSALLEFYTEEIWFLGDFLCKIIPFLENVVTHASILIMVTFSFGRYFAVSRPLQSFSKFQKSSLWSVMFALWVIAGLSASPFLIMTHTYEAVHHKDSKVVSVCQTRMYLLWHYVYLVITFCVFYVLPFFLLVFVYIRMFYLISTTSKLNNLRVSSACNNFKCKVQLIRMWLIIVLAFFLFVMPIRIFSLWLVFSDPAKVNSVGLEDYLNIIWTTRSLLYTHSLSNPIIYNFFSMKFRKAFTYFLA